MPFKASNIIWGTCHSNIPAKIILGSASSSPIIRGHRTFQLQFQSWETLHFLKLMWSSTSSVLIPRKDFVLLVFLIDYPLFSCFPLALCLILTYTARYFNGLCKSLFILNVKALWAESGGSALLRPKGRKNKFLNKSNSPLCRQYSIIHL